MAYDQDLNVVNHCRICNGKLKLICSLGDIPLVNNYLAVPNINAIKYPVEIAICLKCHTAQQRYSFRKEKLFSDNII